VRDRIVHIFGRLGFSVAEGPEIEDDWHNFTALNLPENHPARDMQDTFYIHQNPDWLLRTHTSSVQARVMESQRPPYPHHLPRPRLPQRNDQRPGPLLFPSDGRIICRRERLFRRPETNLVLLSYRKCSGKDVKVRFRPSYFPFTEPSAEMDINCRICGGVGCSVCKHTGWVEILGSGMVHPKMLDNFGIDSNKYTGFAFGMGIERVCQLKYRINDLRLYSQNDVRFLRQFTGAV
jgi:phenylalanyl-tRNA synthetase alpha chain